MDLNEQLIKLGDMMGDGMHHEPGGVWIEREYKKVLYLLHPEIKKENRKQCINLINEQVALLIKNNKCECGGSLKQSRSGSKKLDCTNCDKHYTAKAKK